MNEDAKNMHGTDGLPEGFVRVADVVPEALQEIRYGSAFNFLGRRVDGYEAPIAILTRRAAEALKTVVAALAPLGFRLKIYDAYRPQRAVADFLRWAADPADTAMKAQFYPALEKAEILSNGYIAAKSGHSRGSTVDVTLVDATTGEALDMGGPFDGFDERSHAFRVEGLTAEQIANRAKLRDAMCAAGFVPLENEWWHFTLAHEPYPDTYFDFPIR